MDGGIFFRTYSERVITLADEFIKVNFSHSYYEQSFKNNQDLCMQPLRNLAGHYPWPVIINLTDNRKEGKFILTKKT